MKAIFWQKGETLDITAAEAVRAGDIVNIQTRIGVAGTDIPAGSVGPIHVTGVFQIPKGKEALAIGAALYWDSTAGAITATETGNTPAGYAAADVGADVTVALVKLLG